MGNKYLLDTNICIELLHGRYHISDKIEEIGIEHCVLSEITIAELIMGLIMLTYRSISEKLILWRDYLR